MGFSCSGVNPREFDIAKNNQGRKFDICSGLLSVKSEEEK